MSEETVGKRLRKAIVYTGLTNQAFADKVGISKSYITVLLCKPERSISRSLAYLIEQEFGIDMNWLLHGSGKMVKKITKNINLYHAKRKILEIIDTLDEEQIKVALNFLKVVSQVESEKSVKNHNEEYSKFLEWQNEQKNKK